MHQSGENTADFEGEGIPIQCPYCHSTQIRATNEDSEIQPAKLRYEKYFSPAPKVFQTQGEEMRNICDVSLDYQFSQESLFVQLERPIFDVKELFQEEP